MNTQLISFSWIKLIKLHFAPCLQVLPNQKIEKTENNKFVILLSSTVYTTLYASFVNSKNINESKTSCTACNVWFQCYSYQSQPIRPLCKHMSCSLCSISLDSFWSENHVRFVASYFWPPYFSSAIVASAIVYFGAVVTNINVTMDKNNESIVISSQMREHQHQHKYKDRRNTLLNGV